MEGSVFSQGVSTPQSKKRFNQLQQLATYGVTKS